MPTQARQRRLVMATVAVTIIGALLAVATSYSKTSNSSRPRASLTAWRRSLAPCSSGLSAARIRRRSLEPGDSQRRFPHVCLRWLGEIVELGEHQLLDKRDRVVPASDGQRGELLALGDSLRREPYLHGRFPVPGRGRVRKSAPSLGGHERDDDFRRKNVPPSLAPS